MSSHQIPSHDRIDLHPRRSDLAVVIPVINEGERIRAQLKRMQASGHGLDVFVADGGSSDGSLDEAFLRQAGVRTLLTKRGTGKLSAQLRMAFSAALDDGYAGVITIDGNGKDGVDGIQSVATALRNGCDFVQGSRFIPGGRAVNTPRIRYWAIRLVHAPVTSLGARRRYTDTTNGFRGHSVRLLADPRVAVFRDVFQAYELLAYLPVRAARLGLRTCEVPVCRSYPPGEVPTKISSVTGHMDLLAVVLRAVRGCYDPPVDGPAGVSSGAPADR